jgi:hypothetical protein
MNIVERDIFANRLMDLFGEGRPQQLDLLRNTVHQWRPIAYPFNTQLPEGVVCLQTEPGVSRFSVYVSRHSFERLWGPIVTVILRDAGGQVERSGLYARHSGALEVLRILDAEITASQPKCFRRRTLSAPEAQAALLNHFEVTTPTIVLQVQQ